jgi:hypothetical protein
MKASKQDYQPLRFLDGVDNDKHIILIYDEPKYRKIIEYKFIENGLKKRVNCIYITHGNVKSIENEMQSHGIDVEHYKEKNLLHVIKIENMMENPDGIPETFKNFLQKLRNDFNSPLYITGRTISDISTVAGIRAQLEVEQTAHSCFKKYQCFFLCTFHIDEIEKNMRKKWINNLLNKHHAVIYGTEPHKAIGFDLTLLD